MQLVLWLLLMLPHHCTLKMLLTTLGGTELLISIFHRSPFILKQLMEKKCHRGKKKCQSQKPGFESTGYNCSQLSHS